MTVLHQGRLQCFSAENSSLHGALAGSLAEVMKVSISSGTLFVSDWVIPEGCCGRGYVPNPPEMRKITPHLDVCHYFCSTHAVLWKVIIAYIS